MNSPHPEAFPDGFIDELLGQLNSKTIYHLLDSLHKKSILDKVHNNRQIKKQQSSSQNEKLLTTNPTSPTQPIAGYSHKFLPLIINLLSKKKHKKMFIKSIKCCLSAIQHYYSTQPTLETTSLQTLIFSNIKKYDKSSRIWNTPNSHSLLIRLLMDKYLPSLEHLEYHFKLNRQKQPIIPTPRGPFGRRDDQLTILCRQNKLSSDHLPALQAICDRVMMRDGKKSRRQKKNTISDCIQSLTNLKTLTINKDQADLRHFLSRPADIIQDESNNHIISIIFNPPKSSRNDITIMKPPFSLPHLQSLNISNNLLNNDAFHQLISSTSFPQLTSLNLNSNRIGSRHSLTLMGTQQFNIDPQLWSQCMPNLAILSLKYNDLCFDLEPNDDKNGDLANLHPPCTKDQYDEPDEGIINLDGLPTLYNIEDLDVGMNEDLNPTTLIKLISSPFWVQDDGKLNNEMMSSKLKTLKFRSKCCPLSHSIASILISTQYHTNLSSLSFSVSERSLSALEMLIKSRYKEQLTALQIFGAQHLTTESYQLLTQFPNLSILSLTPSNGFFTPPLRLLARILDYNKLTSLKLSQWLVDPEDPGLIDFFHHPNIAHLTTLRFPRSSITLNAARAIAASPYLFNINYLQLGGRNGPLTYNALLRASSLRGVKKLMLVGVGLDDHDPVSPLPNTDEVISSLLIDPIASLSFSGLEELQISSSGLDTYLIAQHLSKSPHLTKLKKLIFKYCGQGEELDDLLSLYISQASFCPSLEVFELTRTAEALAIALQTRTSAPTFGINFGGEFVENIVD